MSSSPPPGGRDSSAIALAARLGERLRESRIDGDESVWRFSAAGVVPRCVVRPAGAEEVAELVEMARQDTLALVPCGNATHLDVGSPPRRYDVALSTSALNRIVAHEAADMTATAQAGVTLGALNAALAKENQWLPVDPARADDMTLGGLISADRSGPLRLTHGVVRDHLIGLQVVIGDGTRVRGGGRVVKNVAGYDLPKLFTGSYGTLGVIVEATFKLRPRPQDEALFAWPAASVREAASRAVSLLDSPVFPVLLEAVNEAGAETLGLELGAALLIGCAGGTAELVEQEARVVSLSGGAATRCEPARAESLLKALRDFSQPADEDGLVARISTLPTELPPLLGRIEGEARARRVVVEIAAHAGSGVAWCQLMGSTDPQVLALFSEWMRVATRERGGWVVFEWLPPALRSQIDPWGYNENTLRLMASVKRKLDPDAVFSPGRFVGGL